MSTFETEHLDYSELTRVYLAGLHYPGLEQFLNTTQTGFAHTSSGTEVRILCKALFTAVSFCAFQLTLFCILRPILKFLYQPRCHCVPVNERMEPLPNGLFAWIGPTLKYSTNYYLSMGLDTYFFVRFISVLLLFFLVVGSLNLIVLVPVNWTGSSPNYSAMGLDKLSISNIASSKVGRLNFHFVMCIFTIIMFHLLILYELESFVKIRQTFLSSVAHQNSIVAKTLLISNIPEHLKDVEVLNKLFEVVPGGARTIWLSYDFNRMKYLTSQANEAMNILESGQVKYLSNYNCRLNKVKWKWLEKLFPSNEKELPSHLKNDQLFVDCFTPYFFPPIYIKPYYIPIMDRTVHLKFPGIFRIFILERRSSMIDWALTCLNKLEKEMEQEKLMLNEGKIRAHDKIFVEFSTQLGASIAIQCLLSQVQGKLNLCVSEVHPNDILWSNIERRNNYSASIESYIVTLVFVGITILYIVPVSFIGLISQIPLITHLFPLFKWINNFPEEARDTLSHLIPSILLSLLTEFMMVTFRALSFLKGEKTGASREMTLQNWYFAFLFVQQFLVITVSASITVIFKQIVDQPTSIPILLALNLPKAATFFFQYLTVKALTFCGNNFLKINSLILHSTIYNFIDTTPRKKFVRLTKLTKIKWGTTYPVYSIYSSIGLVYTIISPLISIFIIIVFFLVLLYYKYSLKFVYSHINESETHGQMYPTALLHLYTGIYCLECCMIGVLFLSKNEKGECPSKVQGSLMCFVFLVTIFGHFTIIDKYSKHFAFSAILQDKSMINAPRNEVQSENLRHPVSDQIEIDEYYSNRKLLYLHKSFTYEYPSLWLPSDSLGISEEQIKYAESKISSLKNGQTKGAKIEFGKVFKNIQIKVSEAPPGYK